MRKTKAACSLMASTLVEVLIVMIVSGILFLIMFDGVGLIQRYALRLTRGFSAEESVLENYCRLDDLFQRCDSLIAGEREIFYFYREGVPQMILKWQDSLLWCEYSGRKDTLFRQVTGIKVKSVAPAKNRIDSLTVVLLYRGAEKYFPFGMCPDPAEEMTRAAENLEKMYNEMIHHELEPE